MKVMEVVSAVVIKVGADGRRRALLGQRAPTSSHAWCWVSLGGKVEPGESWQDALARELREEARVGAPATEASRIASWWRTLAQRWIPLFEHRGTSTTTGAPFRVRCFLAGAEAEEFSGLRPGDGIIGLGWFTAEEIVTLNLGPADAANRGAIIGLLGGDGG